MTLRPSTTLALTLTASLLAQPPSWTSVTSKLEHAATTDNATELKSARADALRFVVAPIDGVPVAAARYGVAYADYRLAMSPVASTAESTGYLDEADQQLREAIREDGAFADAYGLLSALIGIRISAADSVDVKMTLGPEANDFLDHALSLDPENPRLLITQAIGLFRRPAQYGGDPAQAEALLRRAVTRAEAETASGHPWPNWGPFESHFWLGQVLAARHDNSGARSEYEKALAIAPEAEAVRRLIAALGKGW